MMKKSIVLGVLAASLALGSITFASVYSSNTAKEINAATISGGQLYIQVKDTNDLRVGDTVIFGAETDVIFTYLAGNPIFSTGKGIDGHNGDYSKYYFASSEAIPWVVENGVANNTFSFRSIKEKNLEKNLSHPTNGRYLAYGHNYSGPGYSYIQAYGDINTSGSKNNDSSWTVKFDDRGFAHMQRYGEPYQWSEEAEVFTEIRYHGGGTRPNFGYYQDGGRFKIFRKANLSSVYGIVITEYPDKVDYIFGQNSNLEGLEIEVTLYDEVRQGQPAYTPFICSYQNEPDFFTALPVSIARGEGYFRWCGLECSFDANVSHDTSQERKYEKVDYRLFDPRGTYVLGFDHTYEVSPGVFRNTTFVVDIDSLTASSGPISYLPLMGVQNPISDTNYPFDDNPPEKIPLVTRNVVDIVLEEVDDGYDGTIKCTFIKSGGSYLINNGSGNFIKGSISGGGMGIISTAAMDVDEDNHIRFGFGNGILVFDKTTEKIDVADYESEYTEAPSNYIPIELYRLKMTPNLDLAERLDAFTARFFELTSEFDPTGLTRDLDSYNWYRLKQDFSALNDNIKGLLASVTYTHNKEEGRSIEQLVDIYESIVVIYYDLDGFDDFMDRDRSHFFISNPRTVTVNPINCHITDNYIVGSYRYENVTTFEPNDGYVYPEYVEVLMGEQPLREDAYTYDKALGTITIRQHVIVDDITINIEAERQSAAAADAIRNIATVPYLSYDYTKENDTFTFDNVVIRFRSVVSKTLWDELDEDDNNIQGYGVLLSTEAYLGAKSLKSLYDEVDGTNVKKFYVEGETPTLLAADKYEEIDVDSYSWNLKKTVGSSATKINRIYVAVTFIVTRDYGVVFLGQATASVRSLANDMIASGQYNESSLDGSLNYLANLEDN